MSNVDQQLQAWAFRNAPADIRLYRQSSWTATSGDAGFRRYFRLNCEPSLLAVHAPPEHENNIGFVRKAEALRQAGLRVPLIHAVDFENGFLLIEDFGSVHCLDLLNSQQFEPLYNLADEALLTIQSCQSGLELFPSYSEEKLLAELRLFPEWFLERLLGLTLDGEATACFEQLERVLIASALEQPQVPVHLDFHSRNLMVLRGASSEPESLGVIDFQDGVIGPVTYDLVSLYRDCYIRWPQEWVSQRTGLYLKRAVELGVLPSLDPIVFHRWFDLMGLQRHIKVLGVFARLWLRDGKPRYLTDLPLVMRYILEVAQQHDACREFAIWFEHEVVPRASACSWYMPWQNAGDKLFEDCV